MHIYIYNIYISLEIIFKQKLQLIVTNNFSLHLLKEEHFISFYCMFYI